MQRQERVKAPKTQTLIEDILALSTQCDNGLREKIELLIASYTTEGTTREQMLESRVLEEIDKRLEREKVLQNQAKMAAMGEMMDAVAHQWKQPLNALSMYGDLLKMDFEAGDVTLEYVEKFVEDIQEQITHMVSTLSEFRTFFRPDKESGPFGLKRCTQSVLLLVHDEMLRNNIAVSVEEGREIIVSGIENEFKHLLLNLLANAKDAFIERESSVREIQIRFYKKGGHIYIEVEDSAGGIDPELFEEIFKPNFTTKRDDKGTGIGLYMSTQIAQKMQGSLTVENGKRGAIFRLELPLP
ncbi:ATP-binding protein [Sulfurimonas sp. HSL-3221]|uniref:sensor histidine kinase n=1 Tax=Sulfurimonadaceae TaxID=2771471 RepID=UPI001E34CEA3|nr:ATP-binding protein [Sulfurimonas sp. HSL-3221]UFS62952.1 ATP-binding protein [Sulfurimonas sp. HSL-3221]